MAKTIDKRIYIWLNQQGIEDNLKSMFLGCEKTGCLKLYFHNPASFSESQMLNDIEWYKKHIVDVGSHQRIRHIYVVINKSNELKIYDI